MAEVDSLVGQLAALQLSHRLAMLRFLPAGLAEIRVFWWIWVESVHPSVNDALSEDLQSSYPSLEVL